MARARFFESRPTVRTGRHLTISDACTIAKEPSLDQAGRRVTRTDLSRGVYEILTERFEGAKYNSPNDICVDGLGAYILPTRDGDRSDMEMSIEGVYRIDPDGSVTRILAQPVVQRPNGIAVTQDSRLLYVVDSCPIVGGNRKIWRFDLDERGDAHRPWCVFDLAPGRGGDGMRSDVDGNLYVAAGITTPRGPHETADVPPAIYEDLTRWHSAAVHPDRRGCVDQFGIWGPGLRTIFITAGKTLYTTRVETPGQVAYPQWGTRSG